MQRESNLTCCCLLFFFVYFWWKLFSFKVFLSRSQTRILEGNCLWFSVPRNNSGKRKLPQLEAAQWWSVRGKKREWICQLQIVFLSSRARRNAILMTLRGVFRESCGLGKKGSFRVRTRVSRPLFSPLSSLHIYTRVCVSARRTM